MTYSLNEGMGKLPFYTQVGMGMSINLHFLRSCYVPGNAVGAGDTVVKDTHECLQGHREQAVK